MHKDCNPKFEFNRGTFLKEPLNEFIELYTNNITEENINKIEDSIEFKNVHLKIDNKDINKKIYFLGNDKSHIFEYGKFMENDISDILQELNQSNTFLYINRKKHEYQTYFIPLKEGNYNIILKTTIDIIDCSFMFYKCDYLTSIDLSSIGSKRVSKMHYMFYECTNLKNIDFTHFNTENVTNMEFLLYGCKSIRDIDLSSFNIENTKKTNLMFDGCQNLRKIKIPHNLYLKMAEKDRNSLKGVTLQLIYPK